MALRTPLTVSPHMYIGDSTGRPLDYGMIFFGEKNKDPEFYPIDIFSDDQMTKPISQPVRTKGGFINDSGDMIELHASEIIYSVKVLDQYGRQVFYKAAMMRNNWNDDVIAQIDAAIESARQSAVDLAVIAVGQAIDTQVSKLGFVIIDSFELGATITQRNQALRKASDGKLYKWLGDLPKTVPANSSPEATGGFTANGWREVSDVALRQDLASPTGIGLVGGFKIVTPEMYGAKSTLGNIVDDSAAVKMAMQSGHHVFLAAKYGTSEGINTGKDGQVVFGISKAVSGLTVIPELWTRNPQRNNVIQMVHDNCRFVDFTADANNAGSAPSERVHGVMCSEVVNFAVERVEAIHCTGYGHWALSNPTEQRTTGYYLGCTSIDNQVLFEQTSCAKVDLYSCTGVASARTVEMFHPYDDNVLVNYTNCSAYAEEGLVANGLAGINIVTLNNRSFGEINFNNCDVRTVNNGTAVNISLQEGTTGRVNFHGGTYISPDGASLVSSGLLDLHVNDSRFEGVGGFNCSRTVGARTTITAPDILAVGTGTDPVFGLITNDGDVTVTGGSVEARASNSGTKAIRGSVTVSDETRLLPNTPTGRLKILKEGIGHVILQQAGATTTFGNISVNWGSLDKFNLQLSVYKDDYLVPYSLNWHTVNDATIRVSAKDLPVGTKVYYRWVLVA
ncbi:hypothetical protein ACTXGL_01310 [Psychrobacter sp. T6-6]|uniref:tail fiber/spike domain-containing protein n=1 Tax=Psychrobacter sp. T6-6 TaxID=3457452 RepID=UPI003FD52CF5